MYIRVMSHDSCDHVDPLPKADSIKKSLLNGL